jgi:hypothetical protein
LLQILSHRGNGLACELHFSTGAFSHHDVEAVVLLVLRGKIIAEMRPTALFPFEGRPRMDSKGSFAPAPDGAALVVPQYQRVGALHDFPRQDELAILLLYFGAGEGDLVAFAEAEPHVFKK